jgi:hypothetical protein
MTEKLSSKKRDIYMTHSFEELGSVHSAVRELTLTIYDSAFKVCGINFILIHDNKTSELTQNEWFDNKCIKARAEFHYARNISHVIQMKQIDIIMSQLEIDTIK